MKKNMVIFLILIVTSFFLVSCYEGFTGPDGMRLLDYLEPEQLKVLIQNPVDDIWIIDVRPADAFSTGHIPSAKSFPSSEIMNRLAELPKDKYLILYCETGGRAQAVLNGLLKQGYTKVMNWGGVSRWKWDLIK